ncbi:MAG: hypothetical protein WC615_09505 [Mucilaginibacter sp.]|jgi:hypothetical protein|uniref:hypothetical protein n=1 Tax=Mucilaginibacter sp. TaxID=1882438 RepID=UPI003562D3A8
MKKTLLTLFVVIIAASVYAQDQPKKLSEGVVLTVGLMQKLSSKVNHTGDIIDMQVTEPYIIGDRVILNKGLKVSGHLTECTKAKGMGKPGTINISVDYLTLEDGRIIKLTSDLKQEGKNRTGSAIAEAVVLTPFFLLKKGKEVTYDIGQTFKVYVAKDYDI